MTATKSNWMIYGANGYTGELIARLAVQRGFKPILAGRSPKVAELARELGCESRIFALKYGAAAHLECVSAVLHCAGPFSATSQPMLDACLQSKTHYLDITGEISVFENVFARSDEFKMAGIAALPGAGFDVVPTDCLAAMLKRKLPDATNLILAFKADGGLSPGTAKSAVEGLALGGRIRRAGKIIAVPVAARSRKIDFKGNGRLSNAMLAPWGDVSTAFYSTGIPNIEFYIAAPQRAELPMKIAALLMRNPKLRGLAQRLVGRAVSGPTAQARASGRCWIWGEASNDAGKTITLRMAMPEGYAFTAQSALECVQRVSAGKLAPGAWTPSNAFGADFSLSFQGVEQPG